MYMNALWTCGDIFIILVDCDCDFIEDLSDIFRDFFIDFLIDILSTPWGFQFLNIIVKSFDRIIQTLNSPLETTNYLWSIS